MSAGTVGRVAVGTLWIPIPSDGPALAHHVIGNGKVALAITGLVGGDCGHSDETSAADARRLAACWNVCDGVSTEDIELLGGGFLEDGLHVVKTLTDERNALKDRLGNAADWTVREAELAAARKLLAASIEDSAAEHWFGTDLFDRIQAMLGNQPAPEPRSDAALALIAEQAQHVVNRAAGLAVVLTVSQRPLLPLAMGHYETIVEVRPARVLAEPIVRGAQ